MSATAELEFTGRKRRRIILAASAGNFAEWYDWGVYGVVATIVAKQFFPESNDVAALLNTYLIFAAGYIARPLGGVLFGRIADKHGRRRALSMTIVVTCLGTALMGMVPTYASIGLLAPVLLLVGRLAQSAGAGGEYASAISFVYEHSPLGRRARNVAVLLATTFVGIMVGSVLARVLAAVMSENAYETYGWRILFLLGLPLAAFGFYLRSRVEETPEFRDIAAERRETKREATPVRDALRRHWAPILLFIVCTASYALLSTTITAYLTTFLIDTNGLSTTAAQNITIASNVVVIAATLAAGPLCDRIGLRRTLTYAGVTVAVLAIPSLGLAAQGTAGGLAGSALIGGCKGLLAVPALLAISAIFPPAVRVTAGGLAYNVTQAVFGGTGPAIGVWLNHQAGAPYGFAAYLSALALVTAVVAYVARDVFDRRYTPTAERERRAPSDRFTREPAPATDRVTLRR
jgi:MHS family proline/betaine transporter-like MFS transporter